MFETSGAGDESRTVPPPPAADRLWRHPSEVGAAHPAVSTPEHGSQGPRLPRFSLGTVVVATSLGALVMLAGLTAAGSLDHPAAAPHAERSATEPRPAESPEATNSSDLPSGVVAVRLTDGDAVSFGAGLVLNDLGDVVTTIDLRGAADVVGDRATADVTVSIAVGPSTWTNAAVRGTDSATGLTVLHLPSSGRLASSPGLVGATTAAVRVGHDVTMRRPGPTSADAVPGAGARVISTNSHLGSQPNLRSGLLTLTSAAPISPADVGVDHRTGAVATLVLPDDDNPTDEIAYGVPAALAIEIGRQIEQDGRAMHGRLGAPLVTVDGRVVVAPGTDPNDPLLPGDEVLVVNGRPVHSEAEIVGALLGAGNRERVPVVIRRGTRQLPLDAPMTIDERSGPLAQLASTTTLP